MTDDATTDPTPEAPDSPGPSGEGNPGADPATPAGEAALGAETAPEHHPEGLHDVSEATIDSDAADVDGPPSLTPEEIAQVVTERDELTDQMLRARADFDNLNKRRQREVAEARDRGAASLVERLLDVLDNFGFALQAAAVSEDTQLAKGVELVHGQLLQALADAGLEEVPGTGADFDPAHHEALMHEEDGEERDHPEVVEVLRTGYRFKGQLLRAAWVKVVG